MTRPLVFVSFLALAIASPFGVNALQAWIYGPHAAGLAIHDGGAP